MTSVFYTQPTKKLSSRPESALLADAVERPLYLSLAGTAANLQLCCRCCCRP